MGRTLLFSVTMKDIEQQTFHAGGPGGQNQNKRNTGIRLIHRASGAVAECREERSQLQNKKRALQKLKDHPKFKIWVAQESWIRQGLKTPEQLVEEDMVPGNLRVEVRKNGKWQQEDI